MKENHTKNEIANSDTVTIILVIALILFGGSYYLFTLYPLMRGPAADMEVNAAIEPNGALSLYQVKFQFVDDLSYSQFLSYLDSQKFDSITNYESRTFSTSHSFSITNDSTTRTVIIKARQPFDPNNSTVNIRVKKNQDSWEYEDKSIINSSHLPEKYINKLTYTLTIPSELIYANTIDNSSIWWSGEKELTWQINRNKNPLNPLGNNIPSPTIYAKFEVPEQNAIPRVVIILCAGILILIGLIYFIRR